MTPISKQPAIDAQAPEPLPRRTVLILSITVGVIVANIYYIQPLLGEIARTFHLSVTQAGGVAMLSQAGTAAGMLLFVPLGDKFERRSLVLALIGCGFVSLLFMMSAPNVLWLSAASFAMGAFAANVHVVVPFAAHLAAPQERGRVVGIVVSGILLGVLLARTFSGSVGALWGWRAVYGIAAGLILLLAVLVRATLPVSRPEVNISWSELIRSTFDLVRKHAVLRESALLGALFFAAFSAFWTTLVFLLAGAPYNYATPSAAAGFFGLVGALGAAGAPAVGHLADKHGPRFTIVVALWLTFTSFVFMGLFGQHLAGIIIGVVAMDLGVQSGHVSNQTRIYSIDPAARGRLNMVYMFCYFIGGGLGSYLGALCWHAAGWPCVCAFGAAAAALALVIEWSYGRAHEGS